MYRRVQHVTRVARTGLAFAIFGLSSLFMAIALLPVIQLSTSNRELRQLRTQWLIHRGFGFFLWVIRVLGLARYHRSGLERLRLPGTLVVANHPTLIDAVVLIAEMPQADCIAGQAYFENPFMRGMLRASGYLSNVGGGPTLVAAAAARLRRGRSLVIFPEGTRSPKGRLGPFQRGAAHIALETGCELLPVRIRCDPPTLGKGQPWYDVPDRTFNLHVGVGEPISPKPFIEQGGSRVRASRALTATLREAFEKG